MPAIILLSTLNTRCFYCSAKGKHSRRATTRKRSRCRDSTDQTSSTGGFLVRSGLVIGLQRRCAVAGQRPHIWKSSVDHCSRIAAPNSLNMIAIVSSHPDRSLALFLSLSWMALPCFIGHDSLKHIPLAWQ